MILPYQRARQWLAQNAAHGDAVVDAAIAGNVQRLRWLGLVMLPLNLLHVVVFWWPQAAIDPLQRAWRDAVGWAHLVMGLTVVVLMLAAQVAHARRIGAPGALARALHRLAPLVALLFTVALSVIDQIVTNDIVPYLIGCVFVSLLFQIRPTEALVLYGLGYAALFTALGSTQVHGPHLLTNRANGLTVAVLGMVLAIVLWQRNTRYLLLQRELAQRNEDLLRQQQELVWLAKRDALTGLFNRGEFLRLAEQELMRAQRHGTDTSIVMIDMDHFKRINDVHGHPAGDAVLRHMAACLLGAVRGTDVVARIGGEEFVVLLPQTTLDAAVQLAEKLVRNLRATPARVAGADPIAITASMGVGCIPAGHTGTVATLYAAADHALYAAKRKGRNRVERAEFDSSLTPSDFQRMRKH